MLYIPIDTKGAAGVKQRVNIDGVTVAMRIYWNEKDAHWFLDLESADGKRNGVRCVPSSRLLGSLNPVIASGDFAILKDDQSDDAGLVFDNMGTTYGLYYVTAAESAQLVAVGAL